MMHDVVTEDTVSRTAKMSRLFLFRTSAANDIATAAGGRRADLEPCRDREHRSNEGLLVLTGVGKGGLA